MNATTIVTTPRQKVHSPPGRMEQRRLHEFFYDRQGCYPGRNRPGQWLVRRAGDARAVRAFPPGARREVELYVLSLDAPEVCREVQRVIEHHTESRQGEAISRRAVRAGFILRDGLLRAGRSMEQPGALAGEVARLVSQSRPAREADEPYAVCLTQDGLFCTCEDWANGLQLQTLPPGNPDLPRTGAPHLEGVGLVCKHVIAVLLAEHLGLEKPPEAG